MAERPTRLGLSCYASKPRWYVDSMPGAPPPQAQCSSGCCVGQAVYCEWESSHMWPSVAPTLPRFTHTTFAKKFKDMVQRGSYSKPLQHLVKETYGGCGAGCVWVVVGGGEGGGPRATAVTREQQLRWCDWGARLSVESPAELGSHQGVNVNAWDCPVSEAVGLPRLSQ